MSADAEEAKMQEARNALQKYMFYFTRFDNHQKSIQFAKKTRVEAEGMTSCEHTSYPLIFRSESFLS